jgi:hypothetical protein
VRDGGTYRYHCDACPPARATTATVCETSTEILWLGSRSISSGCIKHIGRQMLMKKQHHFLTLLIAIVFSGASLGIHAQGEVPKPELKAHKSIAIPIERFLKPQGKPGSITQESESPQPPSGLPPVGPPVDKIPPMRIGDLKCPTVDDLAWEACRNECKRKPDTPCAELCTYRKDANGNCQLWVQCTSRCDEIPGQTEAPTRR